LFKLDISHLNTSKAFRKPFWSHTG